MNKSTDFFSRQFDHQIDASEYGLNVFEHRALPYALFHAMSAGSAKGASPLALLTAEQTLGKGVLPTHFGVNRMAAFGGS